MGIGSNQTRGLEWPTKRQRLRPKGSEEFQPFLPIPSGCLMELLQKAAGLDRTPGWGMSQGGHWGGGGEADWKDTAEIKSTTQGTQGPLSHPRSLV